MNYANNFQKLLHFVCNFWGKSFSRIGISMNVFPHLALFHFPVWRDFTSSFGERHVSVDMKSTDFLVSICQCPFLLCFQCHSSTIFALAPCALFIVLCLLSFFIILVSAICVFCSEISFRSSIPLVLSLCLVRLSPLSIYRISVII